MTKLMACPVTGLGWIPRVVMLAFVLVTVGTAGLVAQGGAGRGHMKGHMRGGGDHMEDMQLIHELLDNGDKITRTVTLLPDGVETVTESSDPALAKSIQSHVASMYRRLKESRPIHARDPLFRAIFEHASQITLVDELTANGIKVTETSTDPYVVKLIQAHAEVLNKFIEHGHSEAMKNHEVPKP